MAKERNSDPSWTVTPEDGDVDDTSPLKSCIDHHHVSNDYLISELKTANKVLVIVYN